jgi:hypothetical protein
VLSLRERGVRCRMGRSRSHEAIVTIDLVDQFAGEPLTGVALRPLVTIRTMPLQWPLVGPLPLKWRPRNRRASRGANSAPQVADPQGL